MFILSVLRAVPLKPVMGDGSAPLIFNRGDRGLLGNQNTLGGGNEKLEIVLVQCILDN